MAPGLSKSKACAFSTLPGYFIFSLIQILQDKDRQCVLRELGSKAGPHCVEASISSSIFISKDPYKFWKAMIL